MYIEHNKYHIFICKRMTEYQQWIGSNDKGLETLKHVVRG